MPRLSSAIERKFGIDAIGSACYLVHGIQFRRDPHEDRSASLCSAGASNTRLCRQQTCKVRSSTTRCGAQDSPRRATSQHSEMTGSWAGAMGHTQFIPTSYLAFAVDADGNGHRDIWNSIPDALATAANLLKKNGWRTGQKRGATSPWPRVAVRNTRARPRPLHNGLLWASRGQAERGFPVGSRRAELKMPGGANGPAFLMTKNFFVIKRYNNSDSATRWRLAYLADEIAGFGGVDQRWPRSAGHSRRQRKVRTCRPVSSNSAFMMVRSTAIFGSGSRAAIAAFQSQRRVDRRSAIPSQKVLQAIRRY
jgi:membrane-bound lytic murein transglycosylase B